MTSEIKKPAGCWVFFIFFFTNCQPTQPSIAQLTYKNITTSWCYAAFWHNMKRTQHTTHSVPCLVMSPLFLQRTSFITTCLLLKRHNVPITPCHGRPRPAESHSSFYVGFVQRGRRHKLLPLTGSRSLKDSYRRCGFMGRHYWTVKWVTHLVLVKA